MRTVALASLTALTLVGLAGCQLAEPLKDTRDIVIAADLELSGATAAVGNAYDRALRLKVEQINARGLLGGRKIKLNVHDNRSDKTLSLTNVAEYANSPDVVAIITGGCNECATATANIINEKRIPAISLAPANVVTPVSDHRYIFKVGPNPQDNAVALVRELTRNGAKTVGLLTTDDAYGEDGVSTLTAELKKAGIQIRGQAKFKATDTDLSQPVQRVVSGKPDALILWAYPNQASLAAVSAHEARYAGKILFDMAAAGDLFLTGQAAAATNNAIMISTQTMAIDDIIANTPAKAARKQWFRDYTSRYGGYYGYASFAADAVQLVADAVETAGNTNRDRIRDVLETTRMDGLSGPIRITPDNHSGLMPQGLSVLVARSGRWRLLG